MPQRSKLFLLIILVLLIVASISTILGYYVYNKKGASSDKFTKQVRNEILSVSGVSKTPNNIEKQLAIINNLKLSDKQRNDALTVLAFYYANEYSYSHDPSFRLFTLNVLGKFAKEQFPSLYNSSVYNIPCADPTCGQKLSSDVQNVLNLIASSNIPERYKNTISGNLTTAGYMPDSNLGEKKDGFTLVINQLNELDNPQASVAAVTLRNYANNHYQFNL